MDDKRLVDLENKISHQEMLLAELNDALTSQQAQLMTLQSRCDLLLERVRTMSDNEASGDPLDERPPHY